MLKIHKAIQIVPTKEELLESLYKCSFNCGYLELKDKYGFTDYTAKKISLYFDYFVDQLNEDSNVIFHVLCDNVHLFNKLSNESMFDVYKMTKNDFDIIVKNINFSSKYNCNYFAVAVGKNKMYYDGNNVKVFVELC